MHTKYIDQHAAVDTRSLATAASADGI